MRPSPPQPPSPSLQRANLASLQSLLEGTPAAHAGGAAAALAASAAEDESVHRKMLALMALDRPGNDRRARVCACVGVALLREGLLRPWARPPL